jgi:hypothetical protein
VLFSTIHEVSDKAKAVLNDKEWLKKLPEGTRVIIPEWQHKYSFLYFPKGSNQPKEVWKITGVGLSPKNDIEIFDAKITASEKLVLVYSDDGIVCSDVIESGKRLPFEVRYLFRENEVDLKAVTSAEISGSPEQNDLKVVIKLYNKKTLIYSMKNSVWVNESAKN